MSLASLPLAGIVLGVPALFALGLASSPHCAVMCAPMTQLAQRDRVRAGFASAALLNLGRLSSYAVLGALVGAAGGGMLLAAEHWNAGSIIRLLSAAFLLAFGLHQWHAARPRPACCAAGGATRRQLPAYVKGLLWGLLPCPLLYAVLGLAAFSGTMLQGALLLGAFGLGTTPLLIGLSGLGRYGRAFASTRLRHAGASLMMLAGAWTAMTTWISFNGLSAFCRGLL